MYPMADDIAAPKNDAAKLMLFAECQSLAKELGLCLQYGNLETREEGVFEYVIEVTPTRSMSAIEKFSDVAHVYIWLHGYKVAMGRKQK